MFNEQEIVNNIVKSYSENIGFIVYTAQELEKLLKVLCIDPKSTHRAIFDLESMSHHLQSEVVKLINMMKITKDDLVLDMGCGNGAPTRLIAKLCGCKIIGVDINPNQIRKAIDCDKLQGVDHLIERRIMDVHETDYLEETFDKIFHNETMGHWMNKKSALACLCKVLKKGGIMGFHEWLKGDVGDLNSAGGSFIGIYAEDIFFQHSVEEINQLLEDANFTVLSSEDTTDIVDRQLRAKLREVEMSRDYYIKASLEEYFYKSINYCRAMIETHYSYLKYGRFLCAKR